MLTKRDLILFETGRLVGVGKTIKESVRQAYETVNESECNPPLLSNSISIIEHYIHELEKGDKL